MKHWSYAYKLSHRKKPGNQRGVATVLIVLLVGMGLLATVLGTAAYIQSTQEQSMAMHAQTQAQMKAWTGAEIVRQYLLQLQTAGNLGTLATAIGNNANTPVAITGVTGVAASFTAVDSITNPTLFTAQVAGDTANGTRAESTSVIRVVYRAASIAGSTQMTPLTFNRNLVLGGSIYVQTPVASAGTTAINVIGDVSTGGNSITGVNTINATGSINIGSGSAYNQLNSNCDVSITGSVSVVAISARRNVCVTGGASVSGTALANGSVLAQSGYGSNGTLSALANATGVSACLTSGTGGNGNSSAATCPAPALSGVDLWAGGAGAQSVKTAGSVQLSSGRIGTLNAQGNLKVDSGSVTTGTIGGTVTKPAWNNAVNVTATNGYTVGIAPAPIVTIPSSTFNAYDLQSLANYAFAVNAGGYPTVAVLNINGVLNGTYFLGNYDGGHVDYLCAALTPGSSPGSPVCQTPALASGTKICKGYSDYNSCFSYSNGTWNIVGTSMAPGIAWFKGNLTVGTGTYYNTFIATGNIITSGQHVTYAPNFAGYSGTVSGKQYAPTGICVNSLFPFLYPTQLCTIGTQTYNASAGSGVGNFAFMAGSWPGTTHTQASYVGGNITIGASSVIHGSIKAGNEFASGGSTTITGSVNALALGLVVQNSMGGSTTFDLTQFPPTFDMTGGGSSGGSSGTTPAGVSIQWARYL